MADNLSKGQLLSYIKRLKQQAANEKDTANSLRSEIEALRADKAAKLVKIQELTGKFASLELPLEELSSENDRLKAKLKEIEQRHAEELVKIRSEAAQAKAELVLQLRTEHTSAIETVKELLAQETETKILQLKADHKKALESMQNQVHQQTNEVTESLCSEQILQAENAAKQSEIDQLTAKIASMEQFHNDTLRSKIQHIEERHAQDLAGELDSMRKKHQAALTEATHRIEFEKKQQHDTLLTAALLEQKESFTELKVKLEARIQEQDKEYKKKLNDMEFMHAEKIAQKEQELAAALTASANCESNADLNLQAALTAQEDELLKRLAERETELMKAHTEAIAEKERQSLLDREALVSKYETELNSKNSLKAALQKKDEEHAKILAEREAEINQIIAEKDNALAAFKCESLSTLKSALQKKDEEHAKLLAECEAQHKAELEAARVEAMEDSSEFLRAEYDGVINALKARHESALEAMRTEIRKQIDTTESEQETHESHAREMAELSEKYEIELRELTQEHHRVLEAERELRISDIKKVRASAIKKQNELKAELDAAETEITRLETRIRDLTQENTRKLQAVHEEKIADIKKCRAAAVKKQNEMKAELDAADAVISKLETQVHALRLESTTQSQTEWTASKRLADVERSLNDRLSEAMTSLTQAESERDDAIRKLEVEKEHRATADKSLQQYLASTKNEKQQLEDAQRQLENLEQRCEIAEQRAENAASRGKELQRKLKLLQEFAKKRDAQAKDYERNGFEALNASVTAFGALDARFEAIVIQNQARADIEGPAQVVVHPEHCKKCKEAHLLVTEAQERAALAEAHQAKLEDDFKHYRARAHRVFSQEKKARNRDPQAEAFESAANQAMIIAADAVIAAARSTAVAADVRIQLFTRLAQQFLNNNPRLTDIPVALDPPVQDIADGGWGNNELEFSPLQQVEQFSELKATFFKFLNSDSQAERLTLLPIISNILQLEPAEFVNVQTKLSFDPNQGDENDDSQHETDSPSSATDNHRVGMAGRVGRGLASVLDAEISIPFF